MENSEFIKKRISDLEKEIVELQGKQILQGYFNDILIQIIAEMTENNVNAVRKTVVERMQQRGNQQLSNVDSAILDHWLRTQLKPD
jgi:hypothetical protein